MTGLTRAAPLLTLLLAASCGPARNEFPPVCPVPDVPGQIAEIARYRGGTRQPNDLIVRARIFDLPGTCKPGETKDRVVASAVIAVDVQRGPAMEGRRILLPAFLAVTDARAIYDEADMPMIVEFPPGIESLKVQSQPKEIELPVTVKRTAGTYGLVAGFRLTPEELAAVRRTAPAVK